MTEVTAIETWVMSRKEQLCALLPSSIQQERFLRNLIMQINSNKDLRNCSVESLARGCIQATTLGLDIGVLGSAYLVPYGGEASLTIGYQGYIDLAYKSGMKAIHTGIVRKNDDYHATEDSFSHNFDPFDTEENRGPVVGVYALVILPTGESYSELMTVHEIEEIRCGSHSANSPAWRVHWGEMAKKVCIRRALKRAPLTQQHKEIIHNSDKAEYSYSSKPEVVGKEKLKESLESSRQEVITTVVETPSVWDKHLEQGKDLAKEMGLKGWRKMTPTRQSLLSKRITTEGFKVHEIEKFWTQTREGFLPFDLEKVKDWSVCDLDILMRVPRKGGPDHYQSAMEGGFNNEKAEKKASTFSVNEMSEEKEEG